MAANHVYVFKKSQPSKYLYVAECRCAPLDVRGGGAALEWVGFGECGCGRRVCSAPGLQFHDTAQASCLCVCVSTEGIVRVCVCVGVGACVRACVRACGVGLGGRKWVWCA